MQNQVVVNLLQVLAVLQQWSKGNGRELLDVAAKIFGKKFNFNAAVLTAYLLHTI